MTQANNNSNDSTNPRPYHEIENTNELIRNHRADGHLYAYRDDDEHVIIANGHNKAWDKRVPAERTAVIEGERLWTTPDNWEYLTSVKFDGTVHEEHYHIPETSVDVRIGVAPNTTIGDCWYSVEEVGAYDVEIVSEIDTNGLVNLDPDSYTDLSSDARDALERIVNHPGEFSERWRGELGLYVNDAWDYAHASYSRGEIRTVGADGVSVWPDGFNVIDVLTDHYDVDRDDAKDLDVVLRDRAVPSYPRARPRIVESDLPDSYVLRAVIEAGCSPAEAVDYIMVEIVGESQVEWARKRGKDQSTISGNVNQARRVLK